jgi:hypothetical protein
LGPQQSREPAGPSVINQDLARCLRDICCIPYSNPADEGFHGLETDMSRRAGEAAAETSGAASGREEGTLGRRSGGAARRDRRSVSRRPVPNVFRLSRDPLVGFVKSPIWDIIPVASCPSEAWAAAAVSGMPSRNSFRNLPCPQGTRRISSAPPAAPDARRGHSASPGPPGARRTPSALPGAPGAP